MTKVIDQNWLGQNQNAKAGDSFVRRGIDYMGESTGIFRTMQVMKKTVGLTGAAPVLEGQIGTGIDVLGIVGLPFSTSEAVDAVAALGQDDGVSWPRKAAKAVKDTLSAVASYGYAACFVTGATTARTVASVADLASGTIGLPLAVSDYHAASKPTTASGKTKEAIDHSRYYYLLGLVQSVASVALGALGMAAFVLGAPVVSASVLAPISLAATLLAIRKDLLKTSGEYKIIKFDKFAVS